MKTLVLCVALLMSSDAAHSQSCLNYLLLQNNKTVEMTIYNKKGKEDGKQVWKVSNVQSTDNATTATVNSEFFNDKGKSLNKAQNEIQCNGGKLMMNMKLMLNDEQLKQMGEGATANATGEFLEYPASLTVGATLPDGNLEMEVTNDDGMKIAMNLSISERTVTGKETVTSPAGVWECYTITSRQKIVTKIAGIGIPIKTDVTEWYAPGVGVVKSSSKFGSTLVTAVK